MVTPDEHRQLASKLEKLGFNVETKINDMQTLIDDQMTSSAVAGFSYNAYHTIEEVGAFMDGEIIGYDGFLRLF